MNVTFNSKRVFQLTPVTFTTVILFLFSALQMSAQTTLFSDNFNANNSTTWSTSGAIGSYPNWIIQRSGADWGARVNASILELSNDASGGANADG